MSICRFCHANASLAVVIELGVRQEERIPACWSCAKSLAGDLTKTAEALAPIATAPYPVIH